VAFIAQLLGLGKLDLTPITDAINNSWDNLVIGMGFLYNGIQALTTFLKTLLQVVIGGITHILSDIIHGHLKQVLEDIRRSCTRCTICSHH